VAVRSYLRALTRTRGDVAEVLTLANRLFSEDVSDSNNCTLLLAQLAGRDRSLAYASAGHPPGLLLGAGGALKNKLYSTGVPLGLWADVEYPAEGPIPLEAGDVLIILTDGVTEARSASGEFFGQERVLDVVRTHRGQRARPIVEALFRSVREHQGSRAQADDITAVVVKATG
jgi:sigma-B regulation protein RsbU (phosphoserine phosphatase)